METLYGIVQRKESMNTLKTLEPILIDGHLDHTKLVRVSQEIMNANEQGKAIMLVISSDGGKMAACVNFAHWLEKEKKEHGIELFAKIYTASSGATLISLCADTRIMSTSGSFGLHIGSLTVESNDITKNGVLANRLTRLLKSSSDLIDRLLKERVPNFPIAMSSTLHAKGRLILTPEECLNYGICSELF